MARTAHRRDADSDRVLIIERYFPVPPEAVFRAFTEREELVQWWGPPGASVVACDVDLRAGGAWRIELALPDGQHRAVGGVYREVRPPEHVSFTWAWETDGVRGHETVVALEFFAADGGTAFTLVQQAFADVETRDMHNQGWTSSFDKLTTHLERRT